MPEYTFLLCNLAVAFYNVGTIWAHEVDIFRSWRLVSAQDFHRVQAVHWHKLPYWVLTPFALALMGSIALTIYHPAGSPLWGIWGNLVFQLLALILTLVFWGRWQARLSQDAAGPLSPYLNRILRTHWIRTLLVSAAALTLILWAVWIR